jgi:hypothetical protein
MSLQKENIPSDQEPQDSIENMNISPRMSSYLTTVYQRSSFPSLMALTPKFGLITVSTISPSITYQSSWRSQLPQCTLRAMHLSGGNHTSKLMLYPPRRISVQLSKRNLGQMIIEMPLLSYSLLGKQQLLRNIQQHSKHYSMISLCTTATMMPSSLLPHM